MSAHITFTCDACGRESGHIYDEPTIEQARAYVLKEWYWQQITYDYGRKEITEVRCPTCRLDPANETDTILTREPATEYA